MPDSKNTYYTPSVEILCSRTSRLGSEWEKVNYSAPHWRLYWHESAGVTVFFGNKRIALPPSMFCLIPPNTPYEGKISRPVEQLYIHFLVKTPPYNAVETGIYTWPCNGELFKMAGQLRKISKSGGSSQLRVRSLLSLTLVYAGLSHFPDRRFKPAPMDARVRRALEVIEKNLADPLDNPALAQQAGMNTNAFIRLFRTEVGQTPQAYSLSKRIDKASMQLLFSNRKLEEIARETGFCDRYHLSRVFQKIRGIGPATYRRQSIR